MLHLFQLHKNSLKLYNVYVPLTQSTTTIAPSVTRSAAVTSEEKSTWPGQSIKLTRKPRPSVVTSAPKYPISCSLSSNGREIALENEKLCNYMSTNLERKRWGVDEIVLIGCTRNCQNDKFWYSYAVAKISSKWHFRFSITTQSPESRWLIKMGLLPLKHNFKILPPCPPKYIVRKSFEILTPLGTF